jgi:hypothetical protein
MLTEEEVQKAVAATRERVAKMTPKETANWLRDHAGDHWDDGTMDHAAKLLEDLDPVWRLAQLP